MSRRKPLWGWAVAVWMGAAANFAALTAVQAVWTGPATLSGARLTAAVAVYWALWWWLTPPPPTDRELADMVRP